MKTTPITTTCVTAALLWLSTPAGSSRADDGMWLYNAPPRALLKERVFGGKDLSLEFPELGQSALYCVTELVSQEEIDRFITVLTTILGGH